MDLIAQVLFYAYVARAFYRLAGRHGFQALAFGVLGMVLAVLTCAISIRVLSKFAPESFYTGSSVVNWFKHLMVSIGVSAFICFIIYFLLQKVWTRMNAAESIDSLDQGL